MSDTCSTFSYKKCSFSFFFMFIFISWRLITLQYCSGFCHTLTWISHGFTCITHPDPPPTSLSTRFLWVFPVHQARALVSCIQPGLVICFTLDNIHVSMLFSRNIPPLDNTVFFVIVVVSLRGLLCVYVCVRVSRVCVILVPQTWIALLPSIQLASAVKAWSHNYWTARKFPST